MSIYLSRLFPRSNSSFFLCSGNALQSAVLRLGEDIFLVDAGLGTPRMSMQDELTGVPINRATRFENKVGFTDVVAGESLIKKRILERLFKNLMAGESLIKKRAAARFNSLVGSTDVVAGEPLLLPRRFRQNRAWMELNKIWRTNTKVKGFIKNKIKGGFFVAIAGFITFLPFSRYRRSSSNRFIIERIHLKRRNIVVWSSNITATKHKKRRTMSYQHWFDPACSCIKSDLDPTQLSGYILDLVNNMPDVILPLM